MGYKQKYFDLATDYHKQMAINNQTIAHCNEAIFNLETEIIAMQKDSGKAIVALNENEILKKDLQAKSLELERMSDQYYDAKRIIEDMERDIAELSKESNKKNKKYARKSYGDDWILLRFESNGEEQKEDLNYGYGRSMQWILEHFDAPIKILEYRVLTTQQVEIYGRFNKLDNDIGKILNQINVAESSNRLNQIWYFVPGKFKVKARTEDEAVAHINFLMGSDFDTSDLISNATAYKTMGADKMSDTPELEQYMKKKRIEPVYENFSFQYDLKDCIKEYFN